MGRGLVIVLVLVFLIGSILAGCGGATEGTAEWHADQAYELNNQGCYDEAIEECNKAIELDPSGGQGLQQPGSRLP